MQPQHKTSAPHTAQRGTSLIEILVVLVILVVGILSIVRLFPAGFIALRNAENNTFADRLAQGALEQLKKSGNGLPDAIYMYSTADGFNPNFAPTDFDKTYTPTGANASDAAYNDANKQRYISNETITVPAPHVIGGMAYPPLYVVNYGPIYLPKEYATLSTPAVSVRYLPINSIPWTPQTGDSRPNPSDTNRSFDNPVDILQAGQQKYLVDYGAGQIAVPQATYDQVYTLTVTPIPPTGNLPTPVTLTFLVKATSGATGYNGNWSNSFFDPAAPATVVTLPAGPWVSATATLSRPFRYMGVYTAGTATAPSPTFNSDPYEFALDATNMGTDTNTGVIAFNPLAAGQNGSQPLKARISYMTLDWHILHEDQNVSEGSPSIRLTLNHLKKIGDTQFDQTLYSGLVKDATTPADIVVLNLDTGAVTNLAAPQSGATGGNTFNADDNTGNGGNPAAPTQYSVSYQVGRVTFPDNSPAQHLRFYYAGDADWALAVQKAPSSYKIINVDTNGYVTTPIAANYQALTNSGPTPNSCVIDTAAQRAYFPVCDAGKTVEFDGIKYTSTTANPPDVQVNEASAPISTDYATPTGGGAALPYVNLSNTGLNGSGVITSGIAANTLHISAVRGISAQATVIWHERNRWRTRTIDTLLTQTP